MNPTANRDALHRLADALSEDVIRTPAARLLAEAAEDHGDPRTLVSAFDRVTARAARRSRWRRLAGRLRELGSLLYPWRSLRPLMASAAGLFVVVVAGGVYVQMRNSPVNLASAPQARSGPVEDRWALRQERPIAGAPSAPSPPVASVAAPPGDAAANEPKRVRTIEIRPENLAGAARSSAQPGQPGGFQAASQPAAKREDPPRAVTAFAPAAPSVASSSQPVVAARTESARIAALAAEANTSVATSGAAPSFRWPARGRVISGFGDAAGGAPNEGINLALPAGTDVHAAQDGVVVYAGNGIKSYGNLVLVRHDNGFVTAYAHASKLLVKKGEKVRRGEAIAKSGRTGSVTEPQLHFEIRNGATPVDPAQYLPRG